jgi:transposase
MGRPEDIIADLRALVDRQSLQIDALTSEVNSLKLELAKAKKDSSTSSKSPSSDIVKPPRKKLDRRKKSRRGGQQGHKRQIREPLPPERVNESFVYELDAAEVRELGLLATDEFEIIQHIELLDLPVHVTEHQLRKYLDGNGNTVLPDVPELKGPIFGPRMLAMIGWLKSRAHCSYSTVALWMSDGLQVPVSRSYLAKLCNGTISASLAEAHDELKQAIPQQPQLGSDESSIKNNGKKNWIWCITAPLFTFFHIAATRSRSVLEELVGENFTGFLNFDYFSANCSFAWNFDIRAQYCWAHLIRELRFLLKHPDEETTAWAEQLQDRSRKMFSAWHRRDEMSAEGYHRSMLIQRGRFLEIIRKPPDCKEAVNLADRFRIVEYFQDETVTEYDMSQDYFRFMFDAAVEPTNNHAEQQIRHCVIDRKITQGTRSLAGQRYHERMGSAIATCTKQDRSFFGFLKQAIEANLAGTKTPSLI